MRGTWESILIRLYKLDLAFIRTLECFCALSPVCDVMSDTTRHNSFSLVIRRWLFSLGHNSILNSWWLPTNIRQRKTENIYSTYIRYVWATRNEIGIRERGEIHIIEKLLIKNIWSTTAKSKIGWKMARERNKLNEHNMAHKHTHTRDHASCQC